MNLRSLRSGDASFSPFTALIGLESSGETRPLRFTEDGEFVSVPVIEEARLADYAVLFHELTHLWSMRATLLGGVLSVVAARAWNQWSASPEAPVSMPEQTFRLLGSMLPILEGLATYAELDFTGDEDVDRIHSPLLKVIHFTAPAIKGASNHEEFATVRLSAISEYQVLALLLLEPPEDPLELAYLAGYLYVKALAARLAGLCPRMAPPARMLPLLIRVLCDHPVILEAQKSEPATSDLLAAIHGSALSLDGMILGKIADWIENGDPGEVVSRFDFLDFDTSAKAGRLVFREDSSAWYEGLTEEEVATLEKLRGAGSFYLASWKTGTLCNFENGSFTLRHGLDEVEYRMMSAADFERMYPDRQQRELAQALRTKVVEILSKAIDHEVTAGLYIDLGSGDPGMVFWQEDELLVASPYSLSVFARGREAAEEFGVNLRRSNSFAPALRHRFGEAISTPKAQSRSIQEAIRWHLAQMVSALWEQEKIIHCKLSCVGNGGYLEEMYEWCAPPLALSLPPLPDAVAAAFDRVFDFPGFPGTPGLRFATLMPTVEQAAEKSR